MALRHCEVGIDSSVSRRFAHSVMILQLLALSTETNNITAVISRDTERAVVPYPGTLGWILNRDKNVLQPQPAGEERDEQGHLMKCKTVNWFSIRDCSTNQPQPQYVVDRGKHQFFKV